MTLRFPNRTGQEAVYKTGTPDYVDVDNAATVLSGMVTFAARATADSWANGDQLSIVVIKDNSNYTVWTAKWDSTNEYLEAVLEEDSVGTISDDDDVIVIAATSTNALESLLYQAQFVEVSSTPYTLLAANKGTVHRCTSASATTITIDEDLPVGWHAVFVREGAGSVAFARDGSDTLNGGTVNITMGSQWTSSYIYQAVEGAWVVVAS